MRQTASSDDGGSPRVRILGACDRANSRGGLGHAYEGSHQAMELDESLRINAAARSRIQTRFLSRRRIAEYWIVDPRRRGYVSPVRRARSGRTDNSCGRRSPRAGADYSIPSSWITSLGRLSVPPRDLWRYCRYAWQYRHRLALGTPSRLASPLDDCGTAVPQVSDNAVRPPFRCRLRASEPGLESRSEPEAILPRFGRIAIGRERDSGPGERPPMRAEHLTNEARRRQFSLSPSPSRQDHETTHTRPHDDRFRAAGPGGGPGPLAIPLVRVVAGRRRRQRERARVAGGRVDSRARRQRHRRGGRHERDDGPHRSDERRRRRRSLRHRLRREDQEALRPERVGLGAEGAHRRLSARQGHHDDAAARHSIRDGAGRRERMGRAAHAIRLDEVWPSARAGDRLRRGRISGRRSGERVLARQREGSRRRRADGEDLSSVGPATGRGRSVSQS